MFLKPESQRTVKIIISMISSFLSFGIFQALSIFLPATSFSGWDKPLVFSEHMYFFILIRRLVWIFNSLTCCVASLSFRTRSVWTSSLPVLDFVFWAIHLFFFLSYSSDIVLISTSSWELVNLGSLISVFHPSSSLIELMFLVPLEF